MNQLLHELSEQISFMEVAPENWIGIAGQLGKKLRQFIERYDFMIHGLSLNIGVHTPLDEAFLLQVKDFMKLHNILGYSEHLSYCADDDHMYDLMPIPFTDEAVHFVANRKRILQKV